MQASSKQHQQHATAGRRNAGQCSGALRALLHWPALITHQRGAVHCSPDMSDARVIRAGERGRRRRRGKPMAPRSGTPRSAQYKLNVARFYTMHFHPLSFSLWNTLFKAVRLLIKILVPLVDSCGNKYWIYLTIYTVLQRLQVGLAGKSAEPCLGTCTCFRQSFV